MRLELKMPERIIFEEGCLKELDGCAAELGDNIFIAASRTLLKEGKLDGVFAGLRQRNTNIPFLTGLRGSRLPKWWMTP